MRAMLHPLSARTVFSPIETIVFVFVLSTLAYFHILDGIKHSSFFAPTIPSTLRSAHVRLVDSDWTASSEREWFGAWKHKADTVELQQIVFALDDKSQKVSCCFVSLACYLVRSFAASIITIWSDYKGFDCWLYINDAAPHMVWPSCIHNSRREPGLLQRRSY
jgi:hypothetical protein